MKRKYSRHTFLVMPILLGLLFLAGALKINAVTVYGVTSSNDLVRFGAGNLGTVTTVGAITGLESGETIVGIDFRPATGQLYALGSNSRLYTINKFTAEASFVGAFAVPINGVNFGFDFNPVIDRIRIVSDADQNLVGNPNTGSNVQVTDLFYAAGDANEGADPNVTGSAYDRSFIGTTGTQLYGVDTDLDILVRQANSAGTLDTVGPLGFDVPDVFGFDHTAASNVAYASWAFGGVVRLYTIDLMTGAATNLGAIGNNDITDIALEIGFSEGLTAYGLGPDNQLVQFSTKNPNVLTNSVTVTGLQMGETLEGIDFRPETGVLYAYGTDAAGTVSRSLYVLNPITGAATFIANTDQVTPGMDFGFDFNPTVDRIRIVADTDVNRRANPTTGATIQDGTLAYAAGDANAGADPNIVAVGYENSFGGATSTRLFDIDSDLNILAQQNPANAGTLLTVGPLTWNVSADAGFDIVRKSNRGLAALNLIVGGTPQTRSELYEINTNTGTAAFIAPIGANFPIISLAVGFPTAVNRFDTDANGLANYAVFRPSNGTWNILEQDGNTNSFAFGDAATDFLQPGDYDGDGFTDAAVWRRTNGTWYINLSSTGTSQTVQFGISSDEPVARDYDGDGKTDIGIVRRENGKMIWYIIRSLDGSIRIEQFGLDTDIVAPGDYDGDGRFDIATFRGEPDAPAVFYIQQSTAGFKAVQFGLGSDLVAPGDYDGDGKTDLVVVRTGQPFIWFILRSSDNKFQGIEFGTKPHFIAQNDYDGDGKTDVATYDPINAIFYALRSSGSGIIQVPFGQNGDYPIANYDVH